MKKITIHKKNTFVRGTDEYSTMGKRALNTVYWAMQKHVRYKDDSMGIKFSTMREKMNLESDQRYVETIKDALRELRQPLELNNFTHPIDGRKYQWFSCSVLDEAGFHKDEKGEWIVHVKVSNIIKYAMQIKGGFTPLELIPYANSFRTKYAMKLYEYLRSFGAMSYIDISQNHMMKLLALDEKSKYRYMSDLTALVERQIKEIAKKSDLPNLQLVKSKTLVKEKKFRIIINPKSKKTVDKLEAKTALDNLIKRF